MFKRILFLLVATCLGYASGAANDQFVGDWKLNPSRSRMVDQFKVEGLGGNKYVFDFGAGPETIVVDGTDQPGYPGTTLSVTAESPDSWKVVRKKDGRLLITSLWKLSQDGNTLTDDATVTNASGANSNLVYRYQRKAGKAGFAGTWVSTSQTVNSVFVMRLQPYQGDGLSLISLAENSTLNVPFQAKGDVQPEPNAPTGSGWSMSKTNERAVEMTHKVNGKLVQTRQLALSPDGRTLTMTVHTTGQAEPNILVFDRQP